MDKIIIFLKNNDFVSSIIILATISIAVISLGMIIIELISKKIKLKKLNQLDINNINYIPSELDDSYHISASTAMVLCTLLGLIGTFYGMTDALTSIFNNLSSSNADEIQASKEFVSKAKALLGGMGTAFGTSLVGIACSIILSVVTAISNFILNKQYESVKEKFSKVSDPYLLILQQIGSKMPNSSQDEIVYNLQDISKQFNQLFLHLSKKEESAINSLLDHLKKEVLIPMSIEIRQSNQNSVILQNKLGDFSHHINEQMKANQNNINQLIEANALISNTNQEILNSHKQMMVENRDFINTFKILVSDMKSLETIFRQVTKDVDLQMRSLTQQVLTQLNQAFQTIPLVIEKTRLEQQEALNAFAEQYKASFQVIYDNHNKTVLLLANKLKLFLDNSQQNFEKALTTMAQNVSEKAALLLDEAGNQVKSSLAAVPNMLEKTTKESVAILETFNNQVQNQFTHQQNQFTQLFDLSAQSIHNQQKHLEDVSTHIHSNLKESRNEFELAFKQMSKNVAEEAAKLLANASNELEKGLQSVPNLLVQTRKETIEELTEFKKHYREELSLFFTQQAQHLNSQRRSFEELHHSIENSLQKVRSDFEHILNEVAVQVVKNASQMLEKASLEVENGLRSVPEMLERTRIETQEELSIFREEYQHRLNEFFDAQNNVLDETLGKHRENLSKVIVELQNTFAQESSRRADLYIQMDEQLKKIQEQAEILSRMKAALANTASTMLPQISLASQEIGKQLEQSHLQNIKLQEHIASLHKQFQEDINTFGMSVGQITTELNGLINKSDIYAAQLIEGLGNSCNLISQKIEEIQQLSKIKS